MVGAWERDNMVGAWAPDQLREWAAGVCATALSPAVPVYWVGRAETATRCSCFLPDPFHAKRKPRATRIQV